MDAGQLRAAVATLLDAAPDAITDATPLEQGRLRGSIGRAALDAVVRRETGVGHAAAYTASTFGELLAALGRPAGAVPAVVAPGPSGPACGIDLELVEHLPMAADYWAEPFYAANFTPAEIAYCVMQPDPRPHFAARWCAKEALKKCDNRFLNTAMNQLELSSDGPPVLRHDSRPLPYAVSVSHTPLAAVAAVVAVPSAVVPAEPAREAEPPRRPGVPWLNLLTLLAAGLALWRAG